MLFSQYNPGIIYGHHDAIPPLEQQLVSGRAELSGCVCGMPFLQGHLTIRANGERVARGQSKPFWVLRFS